MSAKPKTPQDVARIGQETRQTRILIGAARRRLETAMRHARNIDDPVVINRLNFFIKELHNEERALERRVKS